RIYPVTSGWRTSRRLPTGQTRLSLLKREDRVRVLVCRRSSQKPSPRSSLLLRKGGGGFNARIYFGRHPSFQFKVAAIEGHHLVQVQDAELMDFVSIILPDIDCVFVFLCDPDATQIRCLTDREQWQVVARFQEASITVESDAKFDKRPFLFPQRVTDKFHFDLGVRLVFHRRRRGFAEIF